MNCKGFVRKRGFDPRQAHAKGVRIFRAGFRLEVYQVSRGWMVA
jgi:hypothetical protein